MANVFGNISFLSHSLFLKVSEVRNISSKCWLPNKSHGFSFQSKFPILICNKTAAEV